MLRLTNIESLGKDEYIAEFKAIEKGLHLKGTIIHKLTDPDITQDEIHNILWGELKIRLENLKPI